jgi:hypothetical protein
MPSSSYYDHKAVLCMKMALVAATREERTRLVILANDYKEKASVPDSVLESSSVSLRGRAYG